MSAAFQMHQLDQHNGLLASDLLLVTSTAQHGRSHVQMSRTEQCMHVWQDAHILARKYADRWLVRSLGMGLFKRPLHRREDPLRRPTFMRQLTLNRASRQVRACSASLCSATFAAKLALHARNAGGRPVTPIRAVTGHSSEAMNAPRRGLQLENNQALNMSCDSTVCEHRVWAEEGG